MKKKIIRSCELKKGGIRVWVYLIKKTDKECNQTYIVDDRYQYINRDGEEIGSMSTVTAFCDRDIAIEAYKGIVKAWL